ncbi:3-demethylubiquinone-9 3-methyltransferase, partial [gut metagenome]
MQLRQSNRALYFKELAQTSEEYFVPYVSSFKEITEGTNVLEIGCGEGGILLPFAKRGCRTVGVDLSEKKIEDARAFFAESGVVCELIASDIFKIERFRNTFDIIICHDVIEHITDKVSFMRSLVDFLSPDGVVF